MRLNSAEFQFENYRVVFVGQWIKVYTRGLVVIGTVTNEWQGKGKEAKDSIMGRKWKPRITDARRVIEIVRKESNV
jgi:hypothetical protein